MYFDGTILVNKTQLNGKTRLTTLFIAIIRVKVQKKEIGGSLNE